jgi:hypothetical protein
MLIHKFVVFNEHRFYHLSLIDYEGAQAKCSEGNKLSLHTVDGGDSANLWLDMYTWNGTKLKYENKQLDNCEGELFSLQSFLKIETNTNTIVVDYETTASRDFQFLLSFKAVAAAATTLSSSTTKDKTNANSSGGVCDKTLKEIRCTRSVNLDSASASTSQLLKHYSCVNKDLICNCISLTLLSNSSGARAAAEAAAATQNSYSKLNRFDMINNCDFFIQTFEN